MATITASGIGSGLDVESIVTQLLAIERKPLDNLESEERLINAQISAYGSLKSKIADFETAMKALATTDSFKLFSANSSDESVLTATADESASAGTYSIEVTALAERDKLRTSAYTDESTVVGEGTLTISVGSDSFNLTIDSSNSTLAGIRDAINNASDNTGVTANIITDANGASLVLSSNDTGTANALTVSVSSDLDGNDTDAAGLSALVYSAGGTKNMTALSDAADAAIQVDGINGFSFTSSTNTFDSAMSGLTISVESLGTSSLTIARDDDAIIDAVNEFADAYNALRTEIKSQRSGQLEADNTLLTMEGQLLDIFNAGTAITGSSYTYLSEIGITTGDDDLFDVDSSDVSSALSADFDSFVSLFSAASEGFAARLSDLASGWLASDGLIDARQDGLNDQLDRNEDDKLRWESRLELIEIRLRSQFTALDTLVSELNSTGNFLTSQLASLSSTNK
jgi:flagellar hook-associated protein 2